MWRLSRMSESENLLITKKSAVHGTARDLAPELEHYLGRVQLLTGRIGQTIGTT